MILYGSLQYVCEDMNWEGIAEVRLKMKEMGERKDLGFCWIELDGGDTWILSRIYNLVRDHFENVHVLVWTVGELLPFSISSSLLITSTN